MRRRNDQIRKTRVTLDPWRVIALSLSAGLLFAALGSVAQDPPAGAAEFIVREAGADGSDEELRAFGFVRQNELLKAREAGEALVRAHPDSYIGHFVLAHVHHYAEANFPKSMFHVNESLRLFEAVHGTAPTGPGWPWRWHARLLSELSGIHNDLEQYSDGLAYMARYNEHYSPKRIAERAWPLMKLHRYDDARVAAEEGVATGEARQIEVGLNSLCALEFEAGNDGASYDACSAALQNARNTAGAPSAVDLTNFAEASRSVFRLDEAERILLEATEAPPAWYGNPWLELGDLYTRGARFPEALQALQKVPAYRHARPPHVRDADRNESRRAIAGFLLTVGKASEALAITRQALVMPDRRAHNSRDPAQDRAVIALLDRNARRTVAQRVLEDAAARPWLERVGAQFEVLGLSFEGWLSARQVVRLLSENDRLVGIHRIGTSQSAVVPPWLLGELSEIAGAGVVSAAVARARERDERPGSDVYYDAFLAEAALVSGDDERAIELATRVRGELGPGESLLRARVSALLAEAYRRQGSDEAGIAYEAAIEDDPGVFRRLGFVIPVRIESNGGDIADAIEDALERSPRLDVDSEARMLVRIDADATGGSVCLLGAGGTVYDCGEAHPEATDSPDDLAVLVVAAFHETAFAPRIDLSVGDINSLDGSNATGRDPLQNMNLTP